MLRVFVIAVGCLYLVAATITYVMSLPRLLSVYLLLNGILVLAGMAFERHRYHATHTTEGPWQRTGERFLDPSTGHLTEVRFNPRTGQRVYVDVDAAISGEKNGHTTL